MNLQEIQNKYNNIPELDKIINLLSSNNNSNIEIKGMNNSSLAFFASTIIQSTNNSHLFILDNKEKAAYFQNDLKEILTKKTVHFLPSNYKRSNAENTQDGGNIILRTEILNTISTKRKCITVTYPEAVAQKVSSNKVLKQKTLEISVNDEIPISFISEFLLEYDFKKVDFVYEPGQFAVRGSIVDIYSYSNDMPYRIDFFDDEIESIRTFDTFTQLSTKKYKNIAVVADIQNNIEDSEKIPFLEFISKKTTIWIDNLDFFTEKINELHEINIEENFISKETLIQNLQNFNKIELSSSKKTTKDFAINFQTKPQPAFNKRFDFLANLLFTSKTKGYTNYILYNDIEHAEQLKNIFASDEIKNKLKEIVYKENIAIDIKDEENFNLFTPIQGVIHTGFTDDNLKINCFTNHQIFDRFHKFTLKTAQYYGNKEAVTLKELNSLQPGDFVVHSDHGIGRFGGLQNIETNGILQEVIRLFYKNNDVLLVNLHNLHKVSKYKGKEGTQPKVYKLGGNAWQKIKATTKKRVKDIARELIALYAERKQHKGFAYSHDTYLQDALETSFIYVDTPDQTKATQDFKADMESETPMDRLICGDVGFGKTEIAIRAAFKAVADNKQVAVLVPTTILALQHFKTFTDRLKDMPCKVDYISRLKSTAQQRETLKALADGDVDIIIGTHRLASKDIVFKDLGLMIVDEEQKFGVAVKDKLKKFKINVDTLTLTATPIPRTLQFSLMGARDLSIINTAPPDRYPIITELHTFDKKIIKEAIEYEIQRNGQVFFIHNRIDNIYEIEAMLRRLVPQIKTGIAHGRMKGPELEVIMSDFINEKFGILIATSIIESGLDIPNANTIIINNAQNFGLSDLHQLRGRVGRSNKKAFCHLLAPPPTVITPEARQRLTAIETFSALGSGFNIAMQDLDIRGAGNMLGGEQSGFISNIGFEEYHKILDQAIVELKESEFKELFKNVNNNKTNKNIDAIKYAKDCVIDTDMEILFPDSYIENITERLKLYRDLDKIKEEEKLQIFEQNLTDRFGEIPKQANELTNTVRLRELALTLGIEKILIRNKKMVCYFIADEQSPFYNSDKFTGILNFVQNHQQKASLREYKGKLTISFQKINEISKALTMLKIISE